LNQWLRKLRDPSSLSMNDVPQFWKSKYFYIGITLGYAVLFYFRRQVQGYYRDYRAVVSLKDLTGKTAIITGGNSGIGLGAAIHLARRNANVIIACRDQKRAHDAVQYIQTRSGNKNVSALSIDLCDLKSVERFASEINSNDDIDIDYLILNAGGLFPSSSKTKDGLCMNFQVNYMSHWYLTNLLLDRIKATASKRWDVCANRDGPPVRIVAVSSGAHSSADIPLDAQSWNEMANQSCTYGQSKLLQIVHMRQLQKELHEYDQMIQCVSITPGAVRSNAPRKYPVVWALTHSLLYPLYWYVARDIMMGAEVILHVCTNDRIVNGGYYSNCRYKETKGKNGCSKDSNVWNQVWFLTDSCVKSLQNNTFE